MKNQPFPGKQWDQANPLESGIKLSALEDATRFIVEERPATTSLLMVRNGLLVYEQYFNGETADSLLHTRSVTKTVVGSLIGLAIQQGHISGSNALLVDIFPELAKAYENSPRKRLTLDSLLSLTDGWKFDEENENDPAWRSKTPAKFMLEECPLANEPGTHFNYSTLTTQVLSHIITRVTRRNALDFAKQEFFSRLTIDAVDWPINQEGDAWGGGGLKMRSRDLAKIGLLYLRGGVWRDERLLPEAFVRLATQQHSSGGSPCGLPYGYTMWLGKIGDHDTWEGLGFGGQRLIMLPALDIVCVSTNKSENNGLQMRDVASLIDQWFM